MAWTVSARGSKTACIAAVNAIPAQANGNAINQLARFKSAIITEINAVQGPLVSVDAFGDMNNLNSSGRITVQTIPGVIVQEIASTPAKLV